ncbi:Uncharacterised protein [Bordetella pertussis]|nr:Uncharacterised protein [Bordetella pertussis]
MLDELMATPSCPVSGHSPMIENVMFPRSETLP